MASRLTSLDKFLKLFAHLPLLDELILDDEVDTNADLVDQQVRRLGGFDSSFCEDLVPTGHIERHRLDEKLELLLIGALF